MKFPLEEQFPYRVGALIVLILFYGIYFAKMLSQKRRGIRTRQIGSRREKSLHRVEFWMSVATLAVVPAQLISIFLGWNVLPPGGRFTGFCLGLMGEYLSKTYLEVKKRPIYLCKETNVEKDEK